MIRHENASLKIAPPGSWPLISVIVVNYNGAKYLPDCLGSLQNASYPRFEILVVENGSLDESAAILTALASQNSAVVPILSSRNLGYAGAVNLAMRTARGSYAVVLNMDVTVTPQWLEPLIQVLESRKDVGAVCPLVALTDRSRINAMGQDIHVSGLGFNRGLGLPVQRAGSEPFRVSGIQGAAFAISRSLWEEIGGLDESGFLYHEDVNLSWLLHLRGLELYCAPASIVCHDYFLSMHPAKLYLLERNRWALLSTHMRLGTRILFSPLLLLTEFLMWTYCASQGISFLRAKWRSCRWVWGRKAELQKRRAKIEKLRVRTDWEVLKGLSWSYHIRQFLTLGRERGLSRRQPHGGIPEEMSDR
ncbi:MAG: glycosyltransferase family 2 protein [Acidobacteriia bacterium]|nr:glycosyltransferase family 2 protein [Terriglobia bacterium]